MASGDSDPHPADMGVVAQISTTRREIAMIAMIAQGSRPISQGAFSCKTFQRSGSQFLARAPI